MAAKRQNSVYTLSSNFTIYPLMSRGCLFAPAHELSDEYEKDNEFFKFFQLFRETVAPNILEALNSQTRNVYPIAIELSAPLIKKLFGNSQTLEIIKISWVKSIVFRNEKELKRFEFGAFEDVNLGSLDLELRVDEDVFEADMRLDIINPEPKTEPVIQFSWTKQIDSLIAFNWGLLQYPSVNLHWSKYLRNPGSPGPIKEAQRDTKTYQCISETLQEIYKPQGSDWRLNLFSIFVSEIYNKSGTSGWVAKTFIEEHQVAIENKLKTSSANYDEEAFHTWISLVKGILDQDKELPRLIDQDEIALRSLILLVVYKSPEALLKVKEFKNPDELGERVWSLAMIASVSCAGMRSLDANMKFSGKKTDNSELLKYLLQSSLSHFHSRCFGLIERKASLSFSGAGDKDAFVVTVSNKKIPFFKRKIPLREELIKAIFDCSTICGFKIEIISPKAFVILAERDSDLAYPVVVSEGLDFAKGKRILSFTVNLTAPRASIFEEAKKGKRPKISTLLYCLDINNTPGINCRIGRDPLQNLCITSDQLLETADKDEYLAAVHSMQKISKIVEDAF